MCPRLLRKVTGAGLGALLALTGCDVSEGNTDDAPTTANTRTPSETDAPQETVPPSASATPLPESGALAPGTYSLTKPAGSVADYVALIVTLPAGWATSEGRVHKRLGQPGEVAFSGWTVKRVYDDPCHWQGSSRSEVDLGDNPRHLEFDEAATGSTLPKPVHGGFANQLGRTPSELTKVELGGQPALKIQLSVPAQLDLATCDHGAFRSWTGWGAGDGINDHHAPGQLDAVYMVDVDRKPLVIDVSHMPATSESDLSELEAIVESMIVERNLAP